MHVLEKEAAGCANFASSLERQGNRIEAARRMGVAHGLRAAVHLIKATVLDDVEG